jgi:hypothetical protein|tara:strand:- start:75 stop:587 length:513 start_codon:yes stop_codon:yes gene_type:complete
MSTLKVNALQNTSGTAYGFIKQVVQASTSTETVISSTTYADTTLTASITPSSTSSKILVIVDQQFTINRSSTANNAGAGIKLLRDSTVIHTPVTNADSNPLEPYGESFFNHFLRFTLTKLDSPSSTSSVTYKTQGRPHLTSASGYVNFQATGNNYVQAGTSYITLLEVAA